MGKGNNNNSNVVEPVVSDTADTSSVGNQGLGTVDNELGFGETPLEGSGSEVSSQDNETFSSDVVPDAGPEVVTIDTPNPGFSTGTPVPAAGTQFNTSGLATTAGMDAGFGGVNTNLNSGFADVGNQLSGLETGQGALATNQGVLATGIDTVNTGIGGLGSDISNLGTSVTDNVTALDTKIGDQFTAAGTQLDTGLGQIEDVLKSQFGLSTDQITKLSQDVLSGQTSINEVLASMSGKQDTYYGGLAEGQSNLQSGLGGLQTNLGDLRTKYDSDTTLANQTRTDMMNNITGGFAENRDARQMDANTAARERTATNNLIKQTASTPPTSSQISYANSARNMATGVGATTPEGVAMQNDFLAKLGNMRSALGSPGLDTNIAQMYNEITSSFDANGKLVADSTDGAGNRKARAIDAEGNLFIGTFNNVGQRTDQKSLNLNQAFSTI
jgi:hypothetical protein